MPPTAVRVTSMGYVWSAKRKMPQEGLEFQIKVDSRPVVAI